MSYYIKRTDVSGSFSGPFSVGEIHELLANGSLSWDDECIEAAGQTIGKLRASTRWRRLSEVSELDRDQVAQTAKVIGSTSAAMLEQVRNPTCYAGTRTLIEITAFAVFFLLVVKAIFKGIVVNRLMNEWGVLLILVEFVFELLACIIVKAMLAVIVDIADVLIQQIHGREYASSN